MGVSDDGISGGSHFPLTSWSVILHAQDPDSPDYARHLGRLVQLYWRPVYCVIRYSWGKPHDEAKDLTQEFFATVVLDRQLVRTYVPERGSFRVLLRSTITLFMRDMGRFRSAKKRGGGTTQISLDCIGADAVEIAEGSTSLAQEEMFDAAWNETVMNEAVDHLEKRLKAEGKGAAFEIFRAYDLEPEGSELSYAALGERMGMTVPQVKHALIHARGMFRKVVTDVVRGYVDDPADLESELRRLMGE